MHPPALLDGNQLPSRAPTASRVERDALWPVWLAASLPIVAFLLEGHIGFGKTDEGFLWYGAQRVLAGEVPVRDFQAYDIGRYYWCAAWMLIEGSQGIVAMRLADSILAACTVAMAIALLRSTRLLRPLWVALAAVTLTVWMVPEYKVADSFAAVLLLVGMTRLLIDPGARGASIFGLCLGIAATIGINHALYGTIAGLFAYAYLHLKGRHPFVSRGVAGLVAGTIVGYAPVLFCFVAVPGFAMGFIDSIRQILESGTTNVALPIPSALTVFDRGSAAFVGALRDSTMGFLFIAVPLFLTVCLWQVSRRRDSGTAILSPAVSPVFIAAVLLGIPYAHYAYSSYGTMHIAVSGLLVLFALWAYPGLDDKVFGVRRGPAQVAVFVCTLFLLLHAHSGYPALRGRSLEPVVVMGDTLRVEPPRAKELALVKHMTDDFPGQSFFAAHDWPGAYATVGQRAPNWEIYQIFSSRPERQQREIERIVAADPRFVILTYGNPAELIEGLEQSHPLILRYVEQCFDEQPSPVEVPYVRVFVAHEHGCAPH
jgi:hypothetical protein